MKMKTPVIASRSGRISRVLVKVGDAVEGGQPLVTIS
jgi:biotin carboxyl carrier protein